MSSYDLPSVDVVTVGTVGPPGQRVFYLQARWADRLVTLKLEKQQVSALAGAVLELAADAPRRSVMGAEGRRYVAERFDRRRLAERYHSLLESLVEGRP